MICSLAHIRLVLFNINILSLQATNIHKGINTNITTRASITMDMPPPPSHQGPYLPLQSTPPQQPSAYRSPYSGPQPQLYRFPYCSPDRKFDPKPWCYLGPPNPDLPMCLIDYNQQTRFFNLASFTNHTTRTPYKDTLLVYTGGKCSKVLGERIAAAGVCFGMGNFNNVSKVVRREGGFGDVERAIRQVNKEVAAFGAAERAINGMFVVALSCSS